MAFLGIDLGTGGVRCVLVEEDGSIRAEVSQSLERLNVATIERGSEQDPKEWIAVLESSLEELFADASNRHVDAVAVDSTSGTVLPVSDDGKALGNGLLYNDMRSEEETGECAEVFGGPCSPTFSLPKILWMRKHLSLPDNVLFLHATDYLNSWLAGTVDVPTDFTNAMKTGVDLETETWSTALPDLRLPKVVAPGKAFGTLRDDLRARWQLVGDLLLVAGATDSNAAFYASGAAGAGDWSTTIGTTLAVKGLSEQRIDDPQGRIYCHKHPDGTWLPGGASNAGGEILRKRFSGRMKEMDEAAATQTRTSHVIYPSIREGERLPYAASSFAPFMEGEHDDEVGFYLGCLEGAACVEALVYELLESLGATVGDTVYATGGAAESPLWLQIRADLLQKRLCVPAHPNSAMGAAVLAAAGHSQRSVGELSRQLITMARTVDPQPQTDSYYADRLSEFRTLCDSAQR